MYPLEVSFRDIDHSEAIEASVRDHAEKLETIHPKIIRGHVTVSAPHRKHKATIYHVGIKLHIAGKDIVVNRESENDHSHEDVYVAIRDAFIAAEKQLSSHHDKQVHKDKHR